MEGGRAQSADHELSQQLDFRRAGKDMEFASNNVCVRVGGVIMEVWVIIRARCYYNKKIKNKSFREGDGSWPVGEEG